MPSAIAQEQRLCRLIYFTAETMNKEKIDLLYTQMADEYTRQFPRSEQHHKRSKAFMVDGGQQSLRLFAPYPLYIKKCAGAYLSDLDQHTLLDFWQGHYANILGHNPPQITGPLSAMLAQGYGLQAGVEDEITCSLAEIVCRQTGSEKVRFTTSGALSTMYAIMLARAFTGRSLVLKAGGGWHGGQPWGLIGVNYNRMGYHHAESSGLPASTADEVIVTKFNNCEELEKIFSTHGGKIACFILEPVLGSGGAIAGKPEYLALARRLTEKHGAILIFDEVLAGFRFRAGNTGALYNIRPDLATFGKIIGGGMPVAAVAGQADVMALCGKERGGQVRFDGGTYSAHPISMFAGKLMLDYLIANEAKIYGALAEMGRQARTNVERIFASRGILARCTGYPNEAVKGSSMVYVNFMLKPDLPINAPEDIADPALCSLDMRERVYKLGMILEGVYTMHGLGSISAAHTPADLQKLYDACDRFARRLKSIL